MTVRVLGYLAAVAVLFVCMWALASCAEQRCGGPVSYEVWPYKHFECVR